MTEPPDGGDVETFPVPVDMITDVRVSPFDIRLYCLLGIYMANGRQTPSAAAIGRALAVSSPTVFRSITKLSTLGWIERVPDPPRPTGTILYTSPKPIPKTVRRRRRAVKL